MKMKIMPLIVTATLLMSVTLSATPASASLWCKLKCGDDTVCRSSCEAKKTAKDTWKKTKEKSGEAWDKTKEVSGEVAEGSKKAWEATTEKSQELVEEVKQKVHEATAPAAENPQPAG